MTDERLGAADWLRYGVLLLLGSLVFLFVVGPREGVFLMLLAVYVLLAATVLLVVTHRRRS